MIRVVHVDDNLSYLCYNIQGNDVNQKDFNHGSNRSRDQVWQEKAMKVNYAVATVFSLNKPIPHLKFCVY